jgi:aminobenzoyl-glutamate utilization protein B
LDIGAIVDQDAELLQTLESRIWDFAELGLLEFRSSALLAETLESRGFRLQRGVAGMVTAFVATWGSGGPVIAFLGEFDALPGLSQEVGAVRSPIEDGGPGHGCGHNLLGVGALGAALALAKRLQEDGSPGTVRFYGCPAEETVDGKAFMVKAGLFDDVDIAITWHPGDLNVVAASSSQAMNGAIFRFHGVASHAAADPEHGRSALDAVELMNVGVNYLREHVPSDARIHYVITEGGEAPNVVPPVAASWYYVRANTRAVVEEIYERVCNVARGAALMTGTTLEIEFQSGCWDVLPNQVIGDRLLLHLQELGGPGFAPEDYALARSLQETFEASTVARYIDSMKARGFAAPRPGDPDSILQGAALGHWGKGETMPGSTDVADISHICPTGQINTATAPLGTPGHSWQNVAAVGSGIGFKGMIYAAKVMALAGCDFAVDPDLIRQARAEFDEATRSVPYHAAVDKIVPPPHVPAAAPWRVD